MRKIRYCLILHDDSISMIIFLYLHGKCIVNHMFSSFSMHESGGMRGSRKFCQRGPTLKTFFFFFFFFFCSLMRGKIQIPPSAGHHRPVSWRADDGLILNADLVAL